MRIDRLVDGFAKSAASGSKTDKMVYISDNNQINEIITTKNILITEQGTLKISQLNSDKIIKEIKPEGFIAKSDINFELFPVICQKILNGEFFKSQTIKDSQRELFKKNINWDNHDSQILILL